MEHAMRARPESVSAKIVRQQTSIQEGVSRIRNLGESPHSPPTFETRPVPKHLVDLLNSVVQIARDRDAGLPSSKLNVHYEKLEARNFTRQQIGAWSRMHHSARNLRKIADEMADYLEKKIS